MNFPAWLDADRGRLTAVAAHFALSQSAVSQWRTNGVPPNRMKAVRDFTGGVVTLDDMLPDPPPRPCIDVAAPATAEVRDAA